MSDLCQPECHWTPDRPRHSHMCTDLNQIGEKCPHCGIADFWLILFGGLLPARVQCQRCGAGFNLTQRLRQASTEIPVSRSNR